MREIKIKGEDGEGQLVTKTHDEERRWRFDCRKTIVLE